MSSSSTVAAEDDTKLVAAALGNESGARRRLADRLLDAVQREVAFVLRRHAAAAGRDPGQELRDMVQEVLVALFERDAKELRRWDPQRGRSLDSFVRLVARRRVARILGQRRGNPWADVPMDPRSIEDDPAADDRAQGLARQLEQRNELGALLDALYAKMSARDVELFDLLFVQERDPKQVAEALGMTRQAVNAWSYRTRKLARSLITHTVNPPSSPARRLAKEKVDHGR
ncbi:hypothetical protein ENSA5_52960 [Enhygromyxa salina]|uniref:Uncharacterized protein n=1 Tax=Enhygromyxa salina TaxID=215803 RepID=A0A2S9XFS4_9BACT|nr:sigma-70 family RNA polymerase sigma factor [Enhygromyxa salina]PRP91716.1 hypothetical protein ENSA5_52960 [Enhygromyxa salina]